jgi:RimJ/RimL family protein N-acetyltransferase
MNADFDYVRELFTKDGIPFHLRPANISDKEEIINNISSVCNEKVFLPTDNFVLTSEWQKVLDKPVDEENGNLLIVAQAGENIVGHLRLFPMWFGAKGRHVGEIGIVIAQPWRERGIGKAMLAYALDWARFAQFQRLIASVFATNLRALKLFLLYNFIQEGCRPVQFLVDGQYLDEILLGRFL